MASTKRTVTTAARELLSEGMRTRLKAVEDLSGALSEHTAAQAAVDRALETREAKAAAVRTVFDQARAAGWSAAELRQLGLVPPPAPRRRQEETTDDPADGDQQDGNASEAEPPLPRPDDGAP